MINKKYFLINPPTVGCLHFLMGQRSSQKVSVIKLKNVGLFIVHERSQKIIPMPEGSLRTPKEPCFFSPKGEKVAVSLRHLPEGFDSLPVEP